MNNKLLMSGIIVIVLFGVMGSIFYYINKQKIPENSAWQPEISTDNWYWKKEIEDMAVEEKNIPEIIKATNDYIADKVGEEYFNKYIKYNPSRSMVNPDLTYYYLHYLVIIPEKGIDFETTTHSTDIQLNVKLSQETKLVEEIEPLQPLTDCHDINKCLNILDRDGMIAIVVDDMEKIGYKAKGIFLDWNFYNFEWRARYDLPNEEAPLCRDKMGGSVSIRVDSLNSKIIERKFDCRDRGFEI